MRLSILASLFLFICLAASACFAPSPPQGLTCSPSNGCPAGQVCAIDNHCYDPSNLPGRVDAGPSVDGSQGCAETDKQWTLQQKLLRQGAAEDDNLGSSIALDDDMLVIGWDRDSSNGNFAGAAVAYRLAGGSWQESQIIRPDDGDTTDYFGTSVAVSGDSIVVGARLDEDLGSLAGSAYSFEGSDTLTQSQKLLPSDADPSGLIFGKALAMEGEVLVVGASGSVSDGSAIFVYGKSGATWTESARIAPIDIGDTTAIYFGRALDLEATRLIVSSPGDEIDTLRFSGSAFILDRAGPSFAKVAKLTPSDPKADNYFGEAVAVSGGTAVVGVPRDDNGKGDDAGAVYVFQETSPGNWSQTEKILPENGEADGEFGTAVAIDGDWMAIGAPRHNTASGDDTGVIELYRRDGSTWTREATLSDAQGSLSARFGSVVAMQGDRLVTTAPRDNAAATGAGAAFVYELSCP